MGNVFQTTDTQAEKRGQEEEETTAASKRQKKEEESTTGTADSSSEDSSSEGADLPRKVPFQFKDLVDEVEAIRLQPPRYISRMGKLRVPDLICTAKGDLVTPPGEGPWILSLAVAGGEPDDETKALAGEAEVLSAESQKSAAAKAKLEAELLVARQQLEELSNPQASSSSKAVASFRSKPSVGTWFMPFSKAQADDCIEVQSSVEDALDAAGNSAAELEAKLKEHRDIDRAAQQASKAAKAAKEKVKAAEAYDFSFMVAIKFDRSWPVKPPVVRFRGVMHHALVDDSGGMLLPFYRTLERDEERKVYTLALTLEAIHRFLIDPLETWGVPRESAPQRLLTSMLANEKQNQQRLSTIKKYRLQVKHEELFQSPPKWRDEWLDPGFWKAASENTPEAWRAILEEHLEKEVFSFKIFTDEFCKLFVEEIFNFYASGLPARRPNSMNNYGIIINEIGLEPMIDELQRMLQPLGQLLWPGGPGTMWDGHHCFIVRYREKEDLGLDMHTDDSDVTFNICLGLDFEGAGLQFCGLMGAKNHRRHTHTYKHVKGTCVCHLGRKRHGADDISSGERLNLILWNHSSTYRKSDDYENPSYEQEEGEPDQVCVSYTHDRDYGNFKEYPAGKEHLKGRGWCPPKPFEYEGFKPDAAAAVATDC